MRVEYASGKGSESVQARLVVGADGRGSAVRKWGKFKVTRDPERLLLAGVLLDNVGQIRDDAFYLAIDADRAQFGIFNPQGGLNYQEFLNQG
jgi:2-polyprenyl-6-methoxyphenol hydroxylase-like FAD-dependent oxidoreductase